MDIYENMRRIRTEHGMTQKQVAQACGIKQSTYRTYELGRANPKPATVAKIAAALGVTAGELYGLTTDTTEQDAPVAELIQVMLAEAGTDTSECMSESNCLLLSYKKLNEKGRAEAVRRLHELACVPEYCRQT